MEQWHVILLLLLGIVLFVASLLIRARLGERYDLRTVDLVLIIIPLLVVLLITGRVKVLDAFGVRADLSELFADAAGTDIGREIANTASPDVDEVVHMLEMASKGGVQEIPKLLDRKTEALVFRLGHGGYYGPAIRRYFDALYASSYFKYLIVLNRDGTFFGLYAALDLAVHFRVGEDEAYQGFADLLNAADGDAQRQLARLPGFVDAGQAVRGGVSKRRVLARMDSLRVNSLPVVDERDAFVGTVERSQLTASMLLEVVNRLEGQGNTVD